MSCWIQIQVKRLMDFKATDISKIYFPRYVYGVEEYYKMTHQYLTTFLYFCNNMQEIEIPMLSNIGKTFCGISPLDKHTEFLCSTQYYRNKIRHVLIKL